jgi:hypothetical protein
VPLGVHAPWDPAHRAHIFVGMNKPLSIAILVAGVILLAWGLSAGDSLASEAKEVVSGTPTDKSMVLILLGAVGIIVGGFSAFFRRHN